MVNIYGKLFENPSQFNKVMALTRSSCLKILQSIHKLWPGQGLLGHDHFNVLARTRKSGRTHAHTH